METENETTLVASSPRRRQPSAGAPSASVCSHCGCGCGGVDADATTPFGATEREVPINLISLLQEFRAEMVAALSQTDARLGRIETKLDAPPVPSAPGRAQQPLVAAISASAAKRRRKSTPEKTETETYSSIVTKSIENPVTCTPNSNATVSLKTNDRPRSGSLNCLTKASVVVSATGGESHPEAVDSRSWTTVRRKTPRKKEQARESTHQGASSSAFPRGPSPKENEDRRVARALQQLQFSDTRGARNAKQLLIADSHANGVNGGDLCNSMHVIRVGGLCFPALERALSEWKPVDGARYTRVIVALGTNDLLHHRSKGFDHTRAMHAVIKLLQAKFPKAKLQLLEPFLTPKLRRMRAPFDELLADMKRARGVDVLQNIDTRTCEFDVQGVHLQGESRLYFVKELRHILGYGRASTQNSDSKKEALTKLLALFSE